MTCKCSVTDSAGDFWPTTPWYDPPPSTDPFYYVQLPPDQGWIDLPCGCKVQLPLSTPVGTWTATTGACSSQLELPFEEEDDSWRYRLSCPCGDYDLCYHVEQHVWGFVKDNDNE